MSARLTEAERVLVRRVLDTTWRTDPESETAVASAAERMDAALGEAETKLSVTLDRVLDLTVRLDDVRCSEVKTELAFRDFVARLDGDGGHAQAGETISEMAARADAVLGQRAARLAELEAALDEAFGLQSAALAAADEAARFAALAYQERDDAQLALRNLVARLDGDGGHAQAGETISETRERADAALVALKAELHTWRTNRQHGGCLEDLLREVGMRADAERERDDARRERDGLYDSLDIVMHREDTLQKQAHANGRAELQSELDEARRERDELAAELEEGRELLPDWIDRDYSVVDGEGEETEHEVSLADQIGELADAFAAADEELAKAEKERDEAVSLLNEANANSIDGLAKRFAWRARARAWKKLAKMQRRDGWKRRAEKAEDRPDIMRRDLLRACGVFGEEKARAAALRVDEVVKAARALYEAAKREDPGPGWALGDALRAYEVAVAPPAEDEKRGSK